jgi:hypothetical protein
MVDREQPIEQGDKPLIQFPTPQPTNKTYFFTSHPILMMISPAGAAKLQNTTEVTSTSPFSLSKGN